MVLAGTPCEIARSVILYLGQLTTILPAINEVGQVITILPVITDVAKSDPLLIASNNLHWTSVTLTLPTFGLADVGELAGILVGMTTTPIFKDSPDKRTFKLPQLSPTATTLLPA
jgi:hypothetical protein